MEPCMETEIEPQTCSACVHGYIGVSGMFCMFYGEFEDDEMAAAADCPMWDPQ